MILQLTKSEIQEYSILKERFFQGASFVVISDTEAKTPEFKRYEEINFKIFKMYAFWVKLGRSKLQVWKRIQQYVFRKHGKCIRGFQVGVGFILE